MLPLVDTLLTPEEWGELGGQWAMSLLEPAQAMVVLAQMNEESPDEEWSAFFGHLPPPVQEFVTSQGIPAYPQYVASIRG